MNTKVSVFVICVEVIIYLLLYNLRDSNFNLHLIFLFFISMLNTSFGYDFRISFNFVVKK